jgi:hypothetical protein
MKSFRAFKSEINELSRKTLGSYAKKSSQDREDQRGSSSSLYKAGDDLNRGGDTKGATDMYSKAGNATRKAVNRKAGHTQAINKLSEISQVNKDKYFQKSQGSHQNMSAIARDGGTSESDRVKLRKKMKDRNQGMARAIGQNKNNW